MTTATAHRENSEKRERYHHGDLRAHLIETVRQLVEEKGVEGFSISEASRRAGVSSAAPYKHFCDKDEIVRAVALEGMERLGDAMRVAADSHDMENFAKLNALGASYVRFAREEPGVFRLMFGITETHGKDEEMIACGHRAYGTLLEVVAAYLGPEAEEEDVLNRSYMLWSFVHGHSFLEIDGKVEASKVGASEDALIAEMSRRMLADV